MADEDSKEVAQNALPLDPETLASLKPVLTKKDAPAPDPTPDPTKAELETLRKEKAAWEKERKAAELAKLSEDERTKAEIADREARIRELDEDIAYRSEGIPSEVVKALRLGAKVAPEKRAKTLKAALEAYVKANSAAKGVGEQINPKGGPVTTDDPAGGDTKQGKGKKRSNRYFDVISGRKAS